MSCDTLGAISLSVHVKVFVVRSRDAAAVEAHSGSGEDAIVLDESLATSGGGEQSTAGWREEEGTVAAIAGAATALSN
jgi:hypothetical protein